GQTIYRRMRLSNYRLKLDQWCPYDITENQRRKRVECCRKLIDLYRKRQTFLSNLLTCDEKQIYFDNSKVVRHWRLTGKLEGEKLLFPKPSIHCKKIMILVFWSAHGVIHYEYLPSGQTIDSEYYCDVLDRVKLALKKHPHFRRRKVYF